MDNLTYKYCRLARTAAVIIKTDAQTEHHFNIGFRLTSQYTIVKKTNDSVTLNVPFVSGSTTVRVFSHVISIRFSSLLSPLACTDINILYQSKDKLTHLLVFPCVVYFLHGGTVLKTLKLSITYAFFLCWVFFQLFLSYLVYYVYMF